MKSFENIFRAVLLAVLVAGLIVAIWHISWLHNQAGTRYEMHISDHPFSAYILDRQERVIYYSETSNGQPLVWKPIPLPKDGP